LRDLYTMATTTGTPKVLIASAILLLAAVRLCSAKEWRGLVPLHSTCEDVKQILNVTDCTDWYDTDEGRVSIDFSAKPCADGWNVSAGTVLRISVYPKSKQLSEMSVDLAHFKKYVSYDSANFTYYSNVKEGLTLEVGPDQKVLSIRYYAALKDEYLHCKSARPSPPVALGFVKFDEYGDIGALEEGKRLDIFASQLRAQPIMQGYIIAYGGRRSRIGEAKDRADCAKNYLTKHQRIESRRLVIVDGGYRELAATELHIRLEPGSLPRKSPTLSPREIRIIKGSWRKDRRSLCRLKTLQART
jgi:hypothetical protein